MRGRGGDGRDGAGGAGCRREEGRYAPLVVISTRGRAARPRDGLGLVSSGLGRGALRLRVQLEVARSPELELDGAVELRDGESAIVTASRGCRRDLQGGFDLEPCAGRQRTACFVTRERMCSKERPRFKRMPSFVSAYRY